MNFYREQPWDGASKKQALDLLDKWMKKTTWYLAEVKGGVQAFTTDRGIDFSIRRIITEEYLAIIKDNKIEP